MSSNGKGTVLLGISVALAATVAITLWATGTFPSKQPKPNETVASEEPKTKEKVVTQEKPVPKEDDPAEYKAKLKLILDSLVLGDPPKVQKMRYPDIDNMMFGLDGYKFFRYEILTDPIKSLNIGYEFSVLVTYEDRSGKMNTEKFRLQVYKSFGSTWSVNQVIK